MLIAKHVSLTQTLKIDASNSAVTKYYYDAAGNIIRQLTPSQSLGSGATWNRIDYTYDSRNRLETASLYDGDSIATTSRYTYSGTGNPLTMTTGLSSPTASGGSTTTYTYDHFGNVISETDPTGEAETYNYTITGRLFSKTNRKGTTDVTAATPQISYTTQYTHDLAGNRTSMTVQMGDVQIQNVAYTYDTLNRLSTVTEDGALKATYTYDTNGNRASLTYANGVSETYSYNLANWVTGLTNKLGSTTLSSYSYTYFASGNQKTKTDHTGKTTTYTYDGLGRLTAESSGELSVSYAYDANSNRTQMSVSGSESSIIIAYSYDAANRLVSETTTRNDAIVKSISYSYDDNGNLLSRATTGADNIVNTDTFQYNTIDQLISHTSDSVTTSYTYNAQGIRTSKTTGALTSYYVLDEENVVGEVQNGAVTASYLRGVNPILMDVAGSESYYLYNAHGDVVQLTSAAGTVSRSYDYDAFGNELDPDTADINPFRYCGEYRDTESGAYYLRARYYDPSIGRFTQEDTYWNTANMIYGAVPQKINQQKDSLGLTNYTYVPDISAILQSGNLSVGSTGILGSTLLKNRQVAEQAVRNTYNATKYTFSNLLPGMSNRIVDGYNATKGIIYEVKYGYTSLSKFVQSEIERDLYLIQSGQVKSAEWHFFVSMATGKGGPSGPLLKALSEAGIKVYFH